MMMKYTLSPKFCSNPKASCQTGLPDEQKALLPFPQLTGLHFFKASPREQAKLAKPKFSLFTATILVVLISIIYSYHPPQLRAANRTLPSTDTLMQQKKEILKKLKDQPIYIVAPSSGTLAALPKNIQANFVLTLSMPEDMLAYDIPFHANTDEYRLNHLKHTLGLAEPQALVWCLRGGYGLPRIVSSLYDLPKPKHPKIVIGYSDITALHLFLSQQWEWQTIHGPILAELDSTEKSLENISRLVEILTDKDHHPRLPDLQPLNQLAKAAQSISGKLTGGNLSIIQNSIGTKWQIDAKAKILFLEEVGEAGYAVDRALTHLKSAGILEGVRAIVFGEFASPKDNNTPYALQRFAAEVAIPVYQTNKFGHGKFNYPLIYNADATIEPRPAGLHEMVISPLSF